MTRRLTIAILLAATALGVGPASADPPCRPLQPPRPICIPEVPTPPIPGIPSIPSPPGPPGLPPVPPGLPGPGIPPIPGGPTPSLDGPWLPANAGLMWFEGQNDFSLPDAPAGEPSGSLWLTRRIAIHPYVPGVMHVGSLLTGTYAGVASGAWATTTPGCILPGGTPIGGADGLWGPARSLAVAASGVDTCSFEAIAYDPLYPYRVYATAYDFRFPGTLEDGGIFVSDDGGLHWRKALGGLRGNGLAVARSLDRASARIVAGFIQRSNGSVGSTPGNGSLVISDDDGDTWRTVTLPPSGCADEVPTSQRITPTVRMHPLNADRIYAGTNAGLYVSTDGGATWRLARQACGGIWGVSLSLDGTRLAIGDAQGRIYLSDRDAFTFQRVADVGGGRVQDVLIDPINTDVMYAATWEGSSAAVYRVHESGGVQRLRDPNLGTLDAIWPANVPQPFPFSPVMRDGSAPTLFLARPPGRLMISTLFRGVFVRPA